MGASAQAAVGDVWDAKTQWSDENNPAGVWSYRNSAGTLLVAAPNLTIGWGPSGWSPTGSVYDPPPSLWDDIWSSQQLSSEFGGHGPWMVRWTSPVEGYVKASGTLLQLFQAERRMKYVFRHKGVAFGSVLMPEFANGNTIIAQATTEPMGPGNRDGLVSLEPNAVAVHVGDTIDFLALAAGLAEGGDGVPTFVVTSARVEQVEAPPEEPPEAYSFTQADMNCDHCVNLGDLMVLTQRWLRNDCTTPLWCDNADSNKSGTVDLVDFVPVGWYWQQCVAALRQLGYVVVSPSGPTDGGDFGNDTPGTQTGGLQEAFNTAVALGKDVYIVGGGQFAARVPKA